MRNIIYYFLLILVSLSCSKEDNEVQTPEQLIDVYRHQIVSFEYNGNSSNQETINGTIGGQNIVIAKGDDNKFNFCVPSDLPLGVNELSIPTLNNFKSKYNVLDVTLTQTPEQELSNFTTITEDFFTSNPVNDNDDQIILDNYQNFKNYLENHATEDEKIQMAKFYKVNKDFIDNLILYDPENPTGRLSDDLIGLIANHFNVTYFAIVSVVTITIIPEPTAKLVAAISAMVLYKKVKNYQEQIVETPIKALNFDFDGFYGTNNRVVNNIIQLNDDEPYTAALNLVSTQLSETDSSNSNSSITSFFEAMNDYNNTIDNLNDVINSLNSIIPFLNLSNLNYLELINNPTNENIIVTPEIMEDITFSINHPNLEIVTASVSANNEFTLQVKIIGNPTQTTISSTLNYSYSDPMTTFSGHFDIEVDGVIYGNEIISGGVNGWNNLGNVCTDMAVSGTAHILLEFNALAPENGVIVYQTKGKFPTDPDWTYMGTPVTFQLSDLYKDGNNVFVDIGYCWGDDDGLLAGDYKYIAPDGTESQIYSFIVPRPY